MAMDYTKVFKKVIAVFNESLDYSFSLENVILRRFTVENGKKVYEQFVTEFGFPHEDVSEEYFQTILAEAFAYGRRETDQIAGIMVREDVKYTEHGLFHVLLHELSHVFCTREEIEDGHFYERFCMGSQETAEDRMLDGYMNAGYAIWRELAAEVIAISIAPRQAYSMSDIRNDIKSDVQNIHGGNPAAKTVMVNLLTELVFSKEFTSKTWPELDLILQKSGIPFKKTVEVVFTQLQKRPFYQIDSGFISSLGEMYLLELTENTLKQMRH